MVRSWGVLYLFTSKSASRHNGVQLFISHLPRCLRTRRLASLLFNPPEPQDHEKTQCFATFLPFRTPASSFFWSFLFWLFSLLTAFSSLHIVGSLISKLPSIISKNSISSIIIKKKVEVVFAYGPKTGPAFVRFFHCDIFGEGGVGGCNNVLFLRSHRSSSVNTHATFDTSVLLR